MIVSEEAVAKVKGELTISRDKRKAIQKMDSSTLSAYLVDIYRSGFEDGANAMMDQDEIKMDWEDVLSVISDIVDEATLKEIDERVRCVL